MTTVSFCLWSLAFGSCCFMAGWLSRRAIEPHDEMTGKIVCLDLIEPHELCDNPEQWD